LGNLGQHLRRLHSWFGINPGLKQPWAKIGERRWRKAHLAIFIRVSAVDYSRSFAGFNVCRFGINNPLTAVGGVLKLPTTKLPVPLTLREI
jgi:hypothetical protein